MLLPLHAGITLCTGIEVNIVYSSYVKPRVVITVLSRQYFLILRSDTHSSLQVVGQIDPRAAMTVVCSKTGVHRDNACNAKCRVRVRVRPKS